MFVATSVDPRVLMDFFALLILGGLLGSLVLLTRVELAGRIRAAVLDVTALVAVGATLGSLYLSEGAGLIPCELCWLQRIAMYPLAIILPMARIRSDLAVLPYVRVLAGLGLLVSLYHVQLQLFPDQSSFCELDNPCSSTVAEAFGIFTIPQLAAGSFLLIVFHASASLHRRKDSKHVNS